MMRHDQLARFDHVETDGDGAQLGGGHAAAGEMIEHARQLADDDANILAARPAFRRRSAFPRPAQ